MWQKTGIGVLIFMGAVLLLTICTIAFGFVGGEEFSPDTFERRRFSYYELPLLRIQVTPIDRVDVTNSLEKHLTANKLIAPRNAANPQWDPVYVSTSSEERREGDAVALCEYLDAMDGQGAYFWLNWTKDNSQIAGVLWPEAAKLSREQLYFLLPDLFRAAKSADDPQQLQQQIAQIVAEQCTELADAQQKLGRHEAALHLLTQAIAYRPGDKDLQEMRAQSLQSLGLSEEEADGSDAAPASSGDAAE